MTTRSLLPPLGFSLVLALCAPALADPLPSWNDTEARARILDFVERVTDPASEDFVPPEARIATFDNDGTLWSEQPAYVQYAYAFDRLREKATADPAILTSDVLRAAAVGDMAAVAAAGSKGLLEIFAVSHAGMTVEAFQADVAAWLETARNPVTGRRYPEMTYQPMQELLDYLHDEGFETWIVSGGGVHFMRVFAEKTYGIPPEQVLGSATPTAYELTADGVPQIVKQPGVAFVDDGPGKVLGIDNRIGRRPILAAGNSDGDFEMLAYTAAGPGAHLEMLVHHTDAARDAAYDRASSIGRLSRGLDEGPARGWLIVDVAKDWAQVFPATE